MVTRGGIAIATATVIVALAACKTDPKAATDDLGAFIHCTTASDCPKNLPMCHSDSHVCVGCLSDFQTCGAGMMCDDATHQCIPADPNAKCRRNADCPRPGVDPATSVVCSVDAGGCLGCVVDNDCVPPDVCVARLHLCGDGCLECLPGQACDRTLRMCLDGGVSDGR